ncbi:helix-turn-helix domain-containing protein [Chloroflexota bacterium]
MVDEQTPNYGIAPALLLGLSGAISAPPGKRLKTGLGFAIVTPYMERLATELERQHQVQLERERVARTVAELRSLLELLSPKPVSPATPSPNNLPSPVPDPGLLEAGNWLKLIRHPSVVLILGGRGKGKSTLGYRLLEYLRWTAEVYVVGLPSEARKRLPGWVGMAATLEDVPAKSIVLVDEAYMPYHARSSMAVEARAMSQLVNLSRQREQTLIFVSQEAKQIDRNITSSANVVIFKDPGMLQLEFDRPELSKLAAQAKQALATITGDKRRWAYVYAHDSDFTGLTENSLPTFWNDKLSRIFAAGREPIARIPKKTPLSQRIEKAKELKQQGLSQGQIAKLLGVSRPTIKNYLEGYPYKA